MDRRESIKSLLLGTLAGGALVTGCAPEEKAADIANVDVQPEEKHYGRTEKEKKNDAELNAEVFFSEHEISSIAVLCDLILPANATIGGATDAGVPEFIEFIVKDIPKHQMPIRGGLMWLDNASNKAYNLEFKAALPEQQKAILDTIAYPVPDLPMSKQTQGIRFFSLMRDLTLTGYYTSKMGIEDLGYKGNVPSVWDGVPEEELKRHGLAYEKEWLDKCIDQNSRMDIAEWDDDGNLIG
ncbi:MAG: gluconate 2-dehydrogenase subunit 3 family protein [Bacteroidota bacterium]